MSLTGNAALAGVMGWPISHSRSPRLHGYWLEQYGIDGAYVPLAVAPDRFGDALKGLQAAGFRGVNVTVPHKEAAFRACDTIDPDAKRIGAVNTILFGDDGSVQGSNTDAFGFIENIRQTADWPGGVAVVLGAGGAARAICVALIDAGATEIRLINRTKSRAEDLSHEFGTIIRAYDWENRSDAQIDASLLVNSTSLGMTGQPPLDINLDRLPASAIVNDIVYAPLETPLLAAARKRGNIVVDGLGMLLHQARPGFEAWFGTAPAVTDALRNFVLGPK
ncbi:MAG: shikimate dehydrogenase [Rhodospirillaceae bacterium]|nr:shikimate dehydrogenase [Rhodospirillaceae bacterium]MDD9913590.1 shikimate dehydrogenase [Rhodospirillaceae bacterium]MDD9924722.1 shikimate dehydrogenase [Rhodospirillaceae bacterium]